MKKLLQENIITEKDLTLILTYSHISSQSTFLNIEDISNHNGSIDEGLIPLLDTLDKQQHIC